MRLSRTIRSICTPNPPAWAVFHDKESKHVWLERVHVWAASNTAEVGSDVWDSVVAWIMADTGLTELDESLHTQFEFFSYGSLTDALDDAKKTFGTKGADYIYEQEITIA